MKTLLISNDDKVIDFFSSFLAERGYDLIIYRWLMKAMDNLEEIKAQIVIINADEYPRHWKTMASFLQSGLGGNEVSLYLYSPLAFSADEAEKSKLLGVKKIFTKLNEAELIDDFASLKKTKLSFPQNNNEASDSIILTDPDDNSFSYGSVEDQKGNTYICSVKDSQRYSLGQILKYVSFYHDGNFTNCSAQIVYIDKEKKSLSLEIKDLYEAC
ncbi:MAG: hypothetical protein K5681_04965 [Treponema sp.]|nr:hypothetical protein [Treponema sp.]